MDNHDRLTVTLPEFAKMVGISRNQAYMLASTNSLPVPVIRLGRRMVLSRRAVENLLVGMEPKIVEGI